MKQIINFQQVESNIIDADLQSVYKYRDWQNDFHKRIITHKEVWFAHPHKLNDPFDMRAPLQFDFSQVNWNTVRDKIKDAGRYQEPNLSEEELEVQVESRYREMMSNPDAYFRKNRSSYIAEEAHYNRLGLFSCCKTAENESMWAHYGNNHTGFAIGFNTVELLRSLNCTIGVVVYDDTPITYYPMAPTDDIDMKEMFQKSTKWAAEEEVRFITSGIGIYKKRDDIFSNSAVKEIVFGINTSEKHQDEIREAASITIPNIPFYKLSKQTDSYGFQKNRIND